MKLQFSCPLCHSQSWQKIGTHKYWRQEHGPGGPWYNHPYVYLRRRILFEIWFPECDSVTLTSQKCQQCGFVCYSPRPTSDDIRNKYDFLKKTEINVGAQNNMSAHGLKMDLKRAECICKKIKKHVSPEARVLDVGGGDGKLMLPFVESGYSCSIVDYNPNPREAIKRWGNTINEIQEETVFDVVICSHVLEHVAEPIEFLRQIRNRLAPTGVAYIEVPIEIFRNNINNPIVSEPVTHINFFTAASLRTAMSFACFEIVEAKQVNSTYGEIPIEVAWEIGRPNWPANLRPSGKNDSEVNLTFSIPIRK